MHWLIVLAIVAVVPVAFVGLAWARARRFLAASHLEELHVALIPLLRRAVHTPYRRTAGGDVRREDVSFMSSAGLALAVTGSDDDEGRTVHLSFSAPGSNMSHAIAHRLGRFLLTIVSQNHLEVDLFFTSSGVHHIVIAGEFDDLQIRDFDETVAVYNASNTPLPFALRSVD